MVICRCRSRSRQGDQIHFRLSVWTALTRRHRVQRLRFLLKSVRRYMPVSSPAVTRRKARLSAMSTARRGKISLPSLLQHHFGPITQLSLTLSTRSLPTERDGSEVKRSTFRLLTPTAVLLLTPSPELAHLLLKRRVRSDFWRGDSVTCRDPKRTTFRR